MIRALAFTAAVALVLASFATAASWRVVKQKSVSGAFAVTAINATIKRPKPRGMAVRLIGRVNSGNAVVACSKGFSIASNSRSYRRAGLYVLPMMRGADSCDVIASVGGSGRVTVQILRLV